MYKTRIKEKWWFSQCGRTWLVCRKQLNTSGVTLNADLEPKTHHQTPMTCTYGIQSFHTLQNCCNRGRNIFFSVHEFFCCHSLEVPFSLLKKGCQYFCPYSKCTSHWCSVMSFWLKVCIYSVSLKIFFSSKCCSAAHDYCTMNEQCARSCSHSYRWVHISIQLLIA